MKDLAKFLLYLAGVILFGALLAPPLYWAAQSAGAHGIFPALAAFKFQKFFDRAALIAAIALLWPTIRWLHIGGWRDLGLEPDARWKQHFSWGFAISGTIVALMAIGYVESGVYRMRHDASWGKVPFIALSALAVAFLEEALFRGAILGLLRRTLKPYTALFWTTALFAIVHFLKPDESFDPSPVQWWSGFAMAPHVFHQFAEPMTFLAGFTTLFMLGWLCGDAALRTRSLWMGIGLHAGVVFVKMSFATLSRRRAIHLPWVGAELQIGLVPVVLLFLGWLIVVYLLSRENRSAPEARR